jgi:YgiT-type zinc finger domain-containing protein
VEGKEAIAMSRKYVEKCPQCGGLIVEKEVTELLSGGVNTAILRVQAGVCLSCGERLYTPELIRQFEEIETKLEQQRTADFKPIGQSFQVAQPA